MIKKVLVAAGMLAGVYVVASAAAYVWTVKRATEMHA